MIERVCEHIHNYFSADEDRRAGTYTIENGILALDHVVEGQYFRIVGSAFNDGVYIQPADDLIDETFTGEVWAMKPPRDFLRTVEEIEAWVAKYGEAAMSPYQSENVIGVYSYTKAGAGTSSATAAGSWETMFKARLNQWRKLYE